MKKIDIYEELKSNDYPGRGIVIGKSADGKTGGSGRTYSYVSMQKDDHRGK